MITEDEAFWAGIAVATMMLGGGFSMLFLHTFTGYGAVVLAMGLLTMAVTIQMRAKPSEHVEVYTPTPSVEITPTRPIENTNETEKPPVTETKTEQPPNEPPKEQPQESAPQTETPQTQPPAAEPVAPPQPQEPAPQSPEPPPQTVEPPRIEEKPQEEPQVAPAAG